MNIKLISGEHLTAYDKKHIAAFIQSGLTQAKINRATWVIEQAWPNLRQYTLAKYVNDRGLGFIGEPLRQSKYTYKIQVSCMN